jgi:APA family basic amino acid/polyamine antiporter
VSVTPDAAVDEHALRRVLGLWDATCVVVGAIVGVGIFFSPRDVAGIAGSAGAAMAAWGVGGLVALLGAITFAELGRLRPVAGGQYHVLRDAFGRPAAFLFVFCNLTAVQAGGVAIISIVCAQNLGVALHAAPPGEAWTLGIATLLTWTLVGVNVVGVRSGAGLQNTTVVLKLLAIAAIVALAAFVTRPAALPAPAAAVGHPATFASLFAGVTLTLFAYGGWQQALWMGGEVKHAERTLPRAILLGVAIVVTVYLAVNAAYFRLLGLDGVRSAHALAADAISVWSPGLGRRVAAAAVAVSAFGVLNAQFLAGPRLTWAMARDGAFFSPFARLSERFATPVAAIVLLGAISTALTLGLGLSRTDQLTTGVVVIDATFFALTALALPILRRREGGSGGAGSWTTPVAVAFAALELLAIVGSVLQKDVRLVAITALGWVAAAAVLWRLRFARRA